MKGRVGRPLSYPHEIDQELLFMGAESERLDKISTFCLWWTWAMVQHRFSPQCWPFTTRYCGSSVHANNDISPELCQAFEFYEEGSNEAPSKLVDALKACDLSGLALASCDVMWVSFVRQRNWISGPSSLPWIIRGAKIILHIDIYSLPSCHSYTSAKLMFGIIGVVLHTLNIDNYMNILVVIECLNICFYSSLYAGVFPTNNHYCNHSSDQCVLVRVEYMVAAVGWPVFTSKLLKLLTTICQWTVLTGFYLHASDTCQV